MIQAIVADTHITGNEFYTETNLDDLKEMLRTAKNNLDKRQNEVRRK